MVKAQPMTGTSWPQAVQNWPEPERQLLAQLAPERLPRHVAIIMDGNGRWAKLHGFRTRNRGHQKGLESVRTITTACAELGLEALTLYAFSTENWRRPPREVNFLMALLARFLVAERPTLMKNGVRFRTIGVTERLPQRARQTLEETARLTAGNKGLVLNIALNYGSRDEIVRAVAKAMTGAATGELKPEQMDEAAFSRLLDTAELPDPDLLIRTSGEMRISNFLLWQIAYTELHVTPVLWPDFRRTQLLEAMIDFARRERRFGGVTNSSAR